MALTASLSRRAALRGLAGLAGLGALGASTALGGCATPQAPGTVRAVADGVYVVAGSGGVADEHNLGRIGNAGFIVGPDGVIAVDTGTSYAHGRALLETIATVTPQPVRLALVTHTRPEFLFGGAAFRERGIPIRMHERCARLMASRCETCLKTLRQQVGEPALAGTAMYVPDQTFDAAHTLTLIGRPVRLLHFGHSSGPGDIAVLDPTTGSLFAGGLLDNQRVPDIQDSDLPGWHAALRALRTLRVDTLVPGHGNAASSRLIDGVERYLQQLESRVRALVTAGESLIDVPDASELAEFAAWDQYEIIHRRNASIAFLRYERELMFRQEPPA